MNLLQKFYIGEVVLYGEKDIYYYFNLINEKFENNTFNSSEVEGTIMSTEPLTYKIRSNSFLESDPKLPEVFKTCIKVVLQKEGSGTSFTILPKTGIFTMIFYSALIIGFVINLIKGTFFKEPSGILTFLPFFTIFYFLDFVSKRKLINDFKKQILST